MPELQETLKEATTPMVELDTTGNSVDIELDDPIPIVVSGGTSLPEGFVTLFKQVIMKNELPFEVSEIRRAKNPLSAVANGLLIKTIADVRGMNVK